MGGSSEDLTLLASSLEGINEEFNNAARNLPEWLRPVNCDAAAFAASFLPVFDDDDFTVLPVPGAKNGTPANPRQAWASIEAPLKVLDASQSGLSGPKRPGENPDAAGFRVLDNKDKDMYGVAPMMERMQYVVCKRCRRTVKISRLAFHLEYCLSTTGETFRRKLPPLNKKKIAKGVLVDANRGIKRQLSEEDGDSTPSRGLLQAGDAGAKPLLKKAKRQRVEGRGAPGMDAIDLENFVYEYVESSDDEQEEGDTPLPVPVVAKPLVFMPLCRKMYLRRRNRILQTIVAGTYQPPREPTPPRMDAANNLTDPQQRTPFGTLGAPTGSWKSPKGKAGKGKLSAAQRQLDGTGPMNANDVARKEGGGGLFSSGIGNKTEKKRPAKKKVEKPASTAVASAAAAAPINMAVTTPSIGGGTLNFGGMSTIDPLNQLSMGMNTGSLGMNPTAAAAAPAKKAPTKTTKKKPAAKTNARSPAASPMAQNPLAQMPVAAQGVTAANSSPYMNSMGFPNQQSYSLPQDASKAKQGQNTKGLSVTEIARMAMRRQGPPTPGMGVSGPGGMQSGLGAMPVAGGRGAGRGAAKGAGRGAQKLTAAQQRAAQQAQQAPQQLLAPGMNDQLKAQFQSFVAQVHTLPRQLQDFILHKLEQMPQDQKIKFIRDYDFRKMQQQLSQSPAWRQQQAQQNQPLQPGQPQTGPSQPLQSGGVQGQSTGGMQAVMGGVGSGGIRYQAPGASQQMTMQPNTMSRMSMAPQTAQPAQPGASTIYSNTMGTGGKVTYPPSSGIPMASANPGGQARSYYGVPNTSAAPTKPAARGRGRK